MHKVSLHLRSVNVVLCDAVGFSSEGVGGCGGGVDGGVMKCYVLTLATVLCYPAHIKGGQGIKQG
jgi:hypothetical protein